MAEETTKTNTTDKLIIDIKVNVKKGATTQITNLTKSLTELNKVVAKVGNLERYANALKGIGKELTRSTANKGISKAQGNANLLETTDVDVSVQKKQTDELNKQEQVIGKITKEKQRQLDIDKKSTKENKTSSGFFAKFARSIGRIALYRAIRSSLSGIVKMFQEGLTNLREFDEVTDSSFKKMELSYTTFKNSIASLFAGVIQSIQPYITSITDTIGNLINRFNEARAVINGSDTYMKILTSDTKEWQEQVEKATGNLLEFDKFLALNNKENNYTGFISEDISITKEEAEGLQNQFEKIKETILIIAGAIAGIGIINLINDFTKWFGVLKNIKSLLTTINSITTFVLLAGAIKAVYDGVKTLIDNWDKLDAKAKVLIPTISVLSGILAGLITLVLAGTGQWVKALAIGGIVAGVVATVATTNKAQQYADGGMVEKGTTFIAGEAGAEVVHTSARGTGVTNIEQFSQAMLQALATYGVARGSDVSFKGDVYIDRTKAGQLLESSVFGEGVRVGHFKRV